MNSSIPFMAVLLVFFIAIEVLCLIPITSSQDYTMIIKNVALTFPKIFIFFGVMLVPFSFCFCIIFRNHSEGEFFENFQSFWTSLFKLSLMLAGEYNVEIVKLGSWEILFVSFFVLTTFWLYALIIGFSVSDVKVLRDNARKKIILENAKKNVQHAEFLYKIYYHLKWVNFKRWYDKNYWYFLSNFYRLDERNIADLTRWKKSFAKICRWFLTKHSNIHKIDKVFVNIETRKVSVKAGDSYENIFSDELLKKKLKELLKFYKLPLIKWNCFKKFMQNDLNKMEKSEFELLNQTIDNDDGKKN